VIVLRAVLSDAIDAPFGTNATGTVRVGGTDEEVPSVPAASIHSGSGGQDVVTICPGGAERQVQVGVIAGGYAAVDLPIGTRVCLR
jgi:hypothetical protein